VLTDENSSYQQYADSVHIFSRTLVGYYVLIFLIVMIMNFSRILSELSRGLYYRAQTRHRSHDWNINRFVKLSPTFF